jgi:rubrerythrin
MNTPQEEVHQQRKDQMKTTIAPPVDNAHVADGCEPFTTENAMTPRDYQLAAEALAGQCLDELFSSENSNDEAVFFKHIPLADLLAARQERDELKQQVEFERKKRQMSSTAMSPTQQKYYNGQPGWYYCNCVECQRIFFGDKRDMLCPECVEKGLTKSNDQLRAESERLKAENALLRDVAKAADHGVFPILVALSQSSKEVHDHYVLMAKRLLNEDFGKALSALKKAEVSQPPIAPAFNPDDR